MDNGDAVLFDPFHGGRVLTEIDCQNLVSQATGVAIPITPELLAALPARWIVQRMLNNLKAVYLRHEDFARAVRTMERLYQLTPDDGGQRRDLGIGLMHAGLPGRAIDHLEAYLAASPDSDDAETIRKLLAKAVTDVGRWN